MKNVICFLLFCLCFTTSYGQGWERTFPLGAFNSFSQGDLIPTPDGGFLLNERLQQTPPPPVPPHIEYHVRKIAADGTLQWSKTHAELFGAPVVAMRPVENNCLLFVVLDGDTTRLVKTNANFQPLWSRVMNAPDHKGFNTDIRVVPGAYVIVYQHHDEQTQPLRIIKTDLDGVVIWEDDFDIIVNFIYRDFVTDSQGNLFVAGEGGNLLRATIGKVSAAGTLSSVLHYPDSPIMFSPVLLNDNSLAFLDFTNKLRFTDGAGQPVNTLDLTDPVYRIAATADGNLLFCTQGNFPSLKKVTPDGTVVWSQTFGDAANAYDKAPFALWPLSDGGAVVFFVASNSVLPFYVVRTDANGLVYTNRLYGNIFADLNNNCLNDPGTDLPAPQITVVAQSSDKTYLATTDTLGNYEMTLDTGTYLLRLKSYNSLWNTCDDSLTVTFGAYDTLEWNAGGIHAATECPWPSVELNAPFLRRCFSSTYNINYGNFGSITADSAIVTVTFDALLTLESATLPYVDLGNNTWQFYLGNLAPLEQGTFQVVVEVDCAAEPGQTHCSSASIHIANPCPESGIETAIIRVNAACEGDSVAFSIRNVGGAPMLNPAEFVIIEDLIVMRTGQFQLPSQDSTVVKCPADGSTSRIYAGHEPGEPPFFAPTAAVEGCNGPVQAGFWNMFPEVITSQSFDRDCQPNVGSFDPNDKQAVPTGYDAEHYIGRGVALDYKIRFQNTGTDTAFTVVVRDTLSPWLDALSLRPGAASHPYTWQLLGSGVLEFRFDNILLPDSSTNLAASQGYVSFHIDQKPGVPLQTVIENQAAIYFDFNAPVLTNTTFHRVAEKFVTVVGAWEPNAAFTEVSAAPNPFNSETLLEIKGLQNDDALTLQITDLHGKVMAQMTSATQMFNIKKGDWPPGVYPFNVFQNGRLLGRGKLMVW